MNLNGVQILTSAAGNLQSWFGQVLGTRSTTQTDVESATTMNDDPIAVQPMNASTPFIASELPFASRTHGIIGGIGWDQTAQSLKTIAEQVLDAAQVPRTSWHNLRPIVNRNGVGSTVELDFGVASDLQFARARIKALRQLGATNHVIYLDVKKSRREMRPARLLKRALESLTDLESCRSDKIELQVNMGAKFIKGPLRWICFVARGQLHWTDYGNSRYSDQERELIESFAESE
jgi:hypothetical protein